MSNHLTAQQRVDKNGKITTRHVKLDPKAKTGIPSLPAPTASAPMKAKKAVKPLARMLTDQTRMTSRDQFNSSPELRAALGIEDDRWSLAMIQASEMQIFDVLSVVSVDNAINLLEEKISSSEDVLEFLDKHDLNDLIVDRREMMERAVALRVNTFDLIDLHASFGMENYDEDTFLGAARVKGTTMLPYVSAPDDETRPGTFYEGILKGEINYDDLAEVTYSALNMHSYAVTNTYDGLKAIKDGSAKYDAALLKEMLIASQDHPNDFDRSLDMINEYGPEYVRGINILTAALKIHKAYSTQGNSYCRELIDYNEAYVGEKGESLNPAEVQRYHSAGIAPTDARHLSDSGMTIDQIVNARENGISAAVTGGWL